MRVSQLFTKTKKNAPADEMAKNARLLIQAGFIHKEMAGAYNFLPLGLTVLNKIIQITREEMNAIGGQEILLTALQHKNVWEMTDRWSDDSVDVWFKSKLKDETEVGLAFTHEEPITQMMRNYIESYKDLPSYPYQFQTKFRNELRSRSGIMRCREFIMKDLYSFSRSQQQHDEFYERCKQAYLNIYKRLGLDNITYVTFASGGSFSKFSHEFQALSDVGEDTIYVHEAKRIAINKEVYTDEVLADLGVKKEELVERKAVELGNIFTLGTRFSEALDLTFTDEQGVRQPVIMGSYGFGPGRVMGMIAEHFADDKGLVWPQNIAPAQIYLVQLGDKPTVVEKAGELYNRLTKAGIAVLYDDRGDVRPGEKFADADLTGIPYRVVVSEKTLQGTRYETKARTTDEANMLTVEEIIGLCK